MKPKYVFLNVSASLSFTKWFAFKSIENRLVAFDETFNIRNFCLYVGHKPNEPKPPVLIVCGCGLFEFTRVFDFAFVVSEIPVRSFGF